MNDVTLNYSGSFSVRRSSDDDDDDSFTQTPTGHSCSNSQVYAPKKQGRWEEARHLCQPSSVCTCRATPHSDPVRFMPWDAGLDLNCTDWPPRPPVLGSVNPRLQLETSDWKECEVMHLFAMAWILPSTNDHSSWRLSSSSPTLPKSWWPLVFLPFGRGGRAPHCP